MAENPIAITPPSTVGLEQTIFRYIVLLHVVYSFTGGIFYISPRLRDIAGGKFLGK